MVITRTPTPGAAVTRDGWPQPATRRLVRVWFIDRCAHPRRDALGLSVVLFLVGGSFGSPLRGVALASTSPSAPATRGSCPCSSRPWPCRSSPRWPPAPATLP